MIGIIDYGLGNIAALATVYKRLNIECIVIAKGIQCKEADKLILPGVGSFDYAMKKFRSSEVYTAVEDAVLSLKKPVLGICVGMQMLADSSEEGIEKGLGWIPGKVLKLVSHDPIKVKLPHMGWNTVTPISDHSLFKSLKNSLFYFVHSYYFEPQNKQDSIAITHYTKEFTCAVNFQNFYGVQFHPEKSHEFGMTLLKNYAEI
ncbi:imidazole glycerol phosphate synthase subunit HisH [Gracilinema caldarium]|uniref:Imidazole glycerol phosphate synthase subunit HisH n=1 Tax=Gracilinema caldarium (strain ATCC 51460 / DSM 7334 / H1) TaxID=744872 RepID=F8F031_GRAC1|nr:imidazole glycerol phosphate synthase subunit HisH [Gracilinema caldarium]AEJ18684.1 Imidazole glycerol phosphate synthase subunit hisH [Gracilinema caldarium DSM 7334]